MSTYPNTKNPTIFTRVWIHSGQVESVHMSERSARSIERRGTHRCLAVQECVVVPIEEYQAIRALHEIVYALEEFQGMGLIITPPQLFKLSDAACALYFERLRQSRESRAHQPAPAQALPPDLPASCEADSAAGGTKAQEDAHHPGLYSSEAAKMQAVQEIRAMQAMRVMNDVMELNRLQAQEDAQHPGLYSRRAARQEALERLAVWCDEQNGQVEDLRRPHPAQE